MTRNWIAANILLLFVAGFLGWRLQKSVTRFNTENDVAKLHPSQDPKQKITAEGGMPPLQPPKRYSAADFAAIANQNAFSETRSKEEKTETPAVPAVPELATKPILVGVTISGDLRLASVVDPAIPGGPGAPRRTHTKRVGDVYQGYTITDITQNQMVLESGYRKEVIPLFDAAKHPPQGTGKTPIIPTRIIAFGSGAGPGGPGVAQPIVSVASRPSGTPGSPASLPIGSSSAGGAQSGITRTSSPQGQGRQAPGNIAQPGGGPAAGRPDESRREVIRTPFGDIIREKPPNP